MYALDQAKKEAFTALKKAIGKRFVLTADMLTAAAKPEFGDCSFPCFELAKGMARNPAEIASELAAKIGPTTFIRKIVAVGPYVNFVFDDVAFAQGVIGDVAKLRRRYGKSTTGKGKKVLVEYAQPNTHKEFHIGHVRNVVLGEAILNILKMNGYETVGASYIGDIGAHVAKALWGLKKFFGDAEIEKNKRAATLGEAYVKATTYLDEHEEAKEEVAKVQRLLEAEEEPWQSLWKETREWSLDEFRAHFTELGTKPDVWYFESDVERPGKELVKKMLTDGMAKKSEGATIVDLDKENLGAFLVLKSDGSSLYATKDLALAFKKEKDFSPDRQIFVIDFRQSHYMQQLFAALRRLGFTPDLFHIAYGTVTLPEGAMSSRRGTVVLYTDLRDAMAAKLAEETKKRHEGWKDKKIAEHAHALALASLKMVMLRQDVERDLTFDMDEAMAVEGMTAPYALYAVTRIASILKKADERPSSHAELLTHPKEQRLVRLCAEFPDVVQSAGATFRVSLVAEHIFGLAQMFAKYYEEVHILDDEDKARIAARLALLETVRQVLENGLALLGIAVVKEM